MTENVAEDAEETATLGEVFREGMKEADARISERHYAAIGRVAASWGYFEAVVDTMTAHLMGVSVEIGIAHRRCRVYADWTRLLPWLDFAGQKLSGTINWNKLPRGQMVLANVEIGRCMTCGIYRRPKNL